MTEEIALGFALGFAVGGIITMLSIVLIIFFFD